MSRIYTWDMTTNGDGYNDIRDVVVSSFKPHNNRLLCSLLKDGWEVIKIKIRHENQNVYYHYSLGKS